MRRRGPISDFLQLRVAGAPAKGLTAWLTAALRDAIATGRLTPGAGLPPTRVLAGELGVSRGVVVQAYQRLADEGLVTARTGAGSMVERRPVGTPGTRSRDRRITLGVGRLPLAPDDTIDLDLSPGVPDLSAFPRAAWLRAERAVLGRVTGSELGYGDPGGSPRLRAELVAWLGRVRGVRAEPDDVIVCAGVAQGLALLAQVLRAEGVEEIGVEDPGSLGARDQLAFWGMRTPGVPVDEQGLRADLLDPLRAVLITPAHQFPTGVVLSPERRRALLSWDGLIVEDDYDAEHRYDRAPVAALQGSAPERVAYLGSVSKSLAPGMRLGWLIAPRGLQAPLLAAKHAADLGNPGLPQLVLAELLANGDYERHLRAVRGRQRRRRDALLAALREHLPQARVTGIAAGLHVLVTFDEEIPDTFLAATAAAHGVRLQALGLHRQEAGPSGLVLGYAAHPPDRLAEAAARLGRAFSPLLRRPEP
ncbi:PLP-dependent aminotransferase family protein [Actinoplanes sp. NPDC051851]|uniref:MocR-like pyridoxine biosynthesis transcription factor PdxR n=1 Tax=Actinoplanes sp. NPDC051851 TaxID=3154753 RepID=UPI00344093ED